MPCSLCHQVGHNRRTCPSVVQVASFQAAPVQPAPVQPAPVQAAASVQGSSPRRFFSSTEMEAVIRLFSDRERRLQEQILLLTDRLWNETPAEPEVLKREPLPKHISVSVFSSLAEEDKRCQICFDDLTEDTLQLSVCGHNFCAGCYEDPRLVNCGVCRKTL